MLIPTPFILDPGTGKLTVEALNTTLGPNTRLVDLQASEIFPRMSPATFKSHEIGYQLKPTALPDRRWVYLASVFDNDLLRRLGFGWGVLRGSWGFQEMTTPEFQEQLDSYVDWLTSILGPSLPVSGWRAYRQMLSWGEIHASSDARSNLPGIGISYADPTHI